MTDLAPLIHLPGDPKFRLIYPDKRMKKVPHIVKVSGGRTSAYMLALLLRHKLLDAKRGDCAIFNNTAAETSGHLSIHIEVEGDDGSARHSLLHH